VAEILVVMLGQERKKLAPVGVGVEERGEGGRGMRWGENH